MLAFSALHFENYPAGSPLVGDIFADQHFLTSPKIQAEIQAHYGCSGSEGLELEDQDGTIISSHWEFHNLATDYMIANSRKQASMSRFTLALFDSTGWYFDVDYSYADPTLWGKNKGCAFKNIDNCEFEEFCDGSGFDYDWDCTAHGRCASYSLAGTCKVITYYGNTVCIDENYEQRNINANLYAN